MKININEVVANMMAAIQDSVADDWKFVKENANAFLTSRKERLELYAELRLTNEISAEFFSKRMEDEKAILESELHAVAIMTKAMAQRAANAAIDVLLKAVQAAAGILI